MVVCTLPSLLTVSLHHHLENPLLALTHRVESMSAVKRVRKERERISADLTSALALLRPFL